MKKVWLVLAAVGCACGDDSGSLEGVARRYTCFGGDFVVTVYESITMTATCSTVVAGKRQQARFDYDGADATIATCEVGGTRYTLYPPLAAQSEIHEHDLKLIRRAECDVYDKNSNAE